MQVIFNGDDFGKSSAVNQAILQAHEHGVLTSASLMVGGEAFDEAVEIARNHPELAVGLHLVVVHGPPVLSPSEIPHLLNQRGMFRMDSLKAGVYYFFSRNARIELKREIEAQFRRFSETGLPLSHVDGHLHFHVHPTVFEILLPFAIQYGAQGFRLPRDDFGLAARYDHHHLIQKVTWAVVFGLLTRWISRRLEGISFASPPRVYGLMQSGSMREDYVVDVLQHLRSPCAELYFHPSLNGVTESLGQSRADLDALLSPAVRRALAERNIERTTYQHISKEWGIK